MNTRQLRIAPCLVTLVAATSAYAQSTPGVAPPPSTQVDALKPSAPPLVMRSVVFSPDRPEARLEFYGIDFVNGVWKEGWYPACVGPCAQYVPISHRYRVGGEAIQDSRTFEIGPGNQPLHLQAKTGPASASTVGTLAIILGGTALLGGALVAGSADFCGISDQPGACSERATTQAIGIVVAAAGGVALLTGIAMLSKNGTIVSGDEPPIGAP